MTKTGSIFFYTPWNK